MCWQVQALHFASAAGKLFMHMTVSDGTHEIEIALNSSSAARALLAKLPLTVQIQNYGGCEKTFSLDGLDVTDAEEGSCPEGTLVYYKPWGKVALVYKNLGAFPELYILGRAVQGNESIRYLSGIVRIKIKDA